MGTADCCLRGLQLRGKSCHEVLASVNFDGKSAILETVSRCLTDCCPISKTLSPVVTHPATTTATKTRYWLTRLQSCHTPDVCSLNSSGSSGIARRSTVHERVALTGYECRYDLAAATKPHEVEPQLRTQEILISKTAIRTVAERFDRLTFTSTRRNWTARSTSPRPHQTLFRQQGSRSPFMALSPAQLEHTAPAS